MTCLEQTTPPPAEPAQPDELQAPPKPARCSPTTRKRREGIERLQWAADNMKLALGEDVLADAEAWERGVYCALAARLFEFFSTSPLDEKLLNALAVLYLAPETGAKQSRAGTSKRSPRGGLPDAVRQALKDVYGADLRPNERSSKDRRGDAEVKQGPKDDGEEDKENRQNDHGSFS